MSTCEACERNRLIPTNVPGLYTLPDHQRTKSIKLSPEFEFYAAQMRAHRNPITYLKFWLSLPKTPPSPETSPGKIPPEQTR